MKLKNFLTVAAVITFAACGTPYQATDSGVVVVPSSTQTYFTEQYPNSTNVVWSSYDPNVVILNDWELTGWQTMDESDYVVRFDIGNENYYAWYDSDGTWIGTAYVVKDYNTLPVYVTNSLNTNYPAYTISSVHKEYEKGRTVYEVVMKKDDGKVVMLVDENGNILKYKNKSL